MASMMDTASFFSEGNANQFEFVLSLYSQVLKLKAHLKSKRPEELIKLDNWYQNELPKKIKTRGKDAHLTHEELVRLMKWKHNRGKFFPQVSYLVKVNTPRAVVTETKKAFRKLPNIEQAINALNNLKGVGTTMASALLAAAAPDQAPFMADECLMAIPEIEGIDYTTKEYLKFVSHIQSTVRRLNNEAGSSETNGATKWSPHRVELALWTHFVAKELKPELLESIPKNGISKSHSNGQTQVLTNEIAESVSSADVSDENSLGPLPSVGLAVAADESTSTSLPDESSTDNNNLGTASNGENDNGDGDSSTDQTDQPPPAKKSRPDQ